jgi:undecaprenyl-diphosphatase
MQGLDELLLRLVAELRSPLLTRIATDITSLGSTTVIVVQAVVAGVFLIIAANNRRGALQLGLATAGAALWVQVLKRLLRRARPVIVTPLVEATGFSDPSGHTASATALYVTLALLIGAYLDRRGRRAAWVIAVVLILLIALSRIYLGVHYPSDVLFGLILGGAWSITCDIVLRIGYGNISGTRWARRPSGRASS